MTKINIKGPLIDNGEKWIYDLFGEDGTCPNDVLDLLPTDGSDVNIVINSGGGYVHVGNEIYTALKSYVGNVTIDIVEAYSAASIVAMAGNPTRITPVGQIMIHNASSYAAGDYHTMDKSSERLQKVNTAAASAYELKTGLSKDELLSLMDRETWLNAEDAKEAGFVDEILFQENQTPRLVANCKALLPENIVQKMQGVKSKLDATGSQGVDIEKLSDELADTVAEKVLSKIADKQEPQNNKKDEPVSPFARFVF